MRKWVKDNPRKCAANNKKYRQANQKKVAAYNRQWRQTNLGKCAAYAGARLARELKATPKWANRMAMQKFYVIANMLMRYTGIDFEVDHIVPLQSRVVCGLHTEANLQILVRTTNRRKSNSFQEV